MTKFTLKVKNSKSPLFLQENNVFDTKPSKAFIEFNSLNGMAADFLNNKFSLSMAIKSRYIITKSDIVSINNKREQLNLEDYQDEKVPLRLINIDSYKVITKKMPARLYTTTVNIDLPDPVIEALSVIQIPLSTKFMLKKHDKFVFCSHSLGTIFFEMKPITVLDIADTDKLNENHYNIDVTKYAYFIVY